MIKTYYLLTKPGIILGNLITTVGGFALASKGSWDGTLFLSVVAGLAGVIGSACTCNCYIDRETDRKMLRTRNRPLAKGIISEKKALLFALIIGVLGLAILARFTNPLATLVAALGFFVYVVLYSFWKKHTSCATFIGSVAGALPPVIGYCAVSHHLDVGALLLFTILVCWQMPHFFAIAMYRIRDYTAASIPVLPVTKGNFRTKVHMVLYMIAFLVAETLLLTLGYAGYMYWAVAGLLSLVWLVLCVRGFKAHNDVQWARQMFLFSLVVITAISFLISVDYV